MRFFSSRGRPSAYNPYALSPVEEIQHSTHPIDTGSRGRYQSLFFQARVSRYLMIWRQWRGLCLLVALMLALPACGYRFGRGELACHYRTIELPYAKGDTKGELTHQVMRNIETAGVFHVVSFQGDLTLQIDLLEFREENLEFRYDRHKTGKIKNAIIPTASRVTAFAEVSLIEKATGDTIKGPNKISASVEFDHTYLATRNEMNIFSLGQLNDIDAARDAALLPLNRALAEKIVDWLMNSW